MSHTYKISDGFICLGGEQVKCTECDQPFTEAQWNDRHWGKSDGEQHERCCPVCNEVLERAEGGEPNDWKLRPGVETVWIEVGERLTVQISQGQAGITLAVYGAGRCDEEPIIDDMVEWGDPGVCGECEKPFTGKEWRESVRIDEEHYHAKCAPGSS